MEKEKEFNCKKCLNKKTMLCEHCSFIESPGGKISKPTQFLEDTGANDKAERAVVLTTLIGYRIKLGKPVPLAWVTEYNALAISEA